MHTARFVIAAMAVIACTTPHAHLAQGRVGLDTVSSSVDSELAAYYATHYLASPGSYPPIRSLEREIEQLLTPYRDLPLSTERLVELARASSNDFAALYFAERTTQQHRALKERFLAYTQCCSLRRGALGGDGALSFVITHF